ncbi:MAG: UDP-3-O-acyl-N-acetylglucosamine deacetylase [Alphaproteobacteria bacterium]|nr:UDP-3-O-acyl-N-acetylglucosamine deacetylase [Alphaproteobacteria bacterium]
MNIEQYQQKTIKHEISCKGVGLHTGKDITMVLKPAPVDTGIVFHRVDEEGHDALIPAHHDYVVDTRMCTCVGNKDGVRVATIEHFMAALHDMGISNLMIDIDGPETPVMDGSAEPFIFLIEATGIKVQNAPLKAIRVLKEVCFKNGDKDVTLKPNDAGLKMKFSIDFPAKAIGHQEVELNFSKSNFKNMFCRARTFGFLKDIEMLRSIGLARGGSLKNAVLVDGDKILNEEGLRYKDEFVRHKMLDAVGDIYMLNMPVIGEYIGNRSGHADTNELLSVLLADKSNYEIVDLPSYMVQLEAKKHTDKDETDADFVF